jgi:hypothetical protein
VIGLLFGSRGSRFQKKLKQQSDIKATWLAVDRS